MVVFTCGHCGESVNKPKVEKHYLTKCRNRNPNLSCMDCFKDFLGNDYESHTKCITEEERYSGKGFQAKEKKGEKKQNAWVEMLQDVLDEQKDASKTVLRIIETISKHNNTPRKKPKFINFVKNVCGHKTNPKDIDQAWDLISVKLAALSSNNNKQNGNDEKQNGNAVTNGKSEENEETTNGDSKLDETAEDGVENGTNEDEKVNGDAEETKPEEKLTKKQRKEEKKRKKYEAALQSAAEVQEETVEESKVEEAGKKGKKNRNKSESNANDEATEEVTKGKNKKRKRQDTVQSNIEINDKIANIENEPIKPKETKKKPKTDEEIEAEALCLHDQNVANGEAAERNGKFNWHSVIISVLQKKGNELPFKRLQKKVLSEYSEYTGDEVDDRIADKFIKKLKSAPNVRVDKNRVLLLED